jgi:hypothetical protein
MPTAPRQNEIELSPDAWDRFERAVDTVSKSGPQHRAKKSIAPMSFVDAVDQVKILMSEPGVPHNYIDCLPKILNRLDKCLVVEPVIVSADGTSNVNRMLQPSDLLLSFMAAFRTKDWPLVGVIEHQLTS